MAARRQIGGGGAMQDDPASQGPGQGNVELGGQLPNEPAPGGFPGNGGYDPNGGQSYPGPTPGGLPNGPETGQSSESPRDRGGATPRMPRSPQPAPSNTAQTIPFPPMGDTPADSMVQRRSPGNLYGALGGLQGGGLGVPQDPTNSAQNMDISGLIQMLLKGGM